jgi:hypothetical protein
MVKPGCSDQGRVRPSGGTSSSVGSSRKEGRVASACTSPGLVTCGTRKGVMVPSPPMSALATAVLVVPRSMPT